MINSYTAHTYEYSRELRKVVIVGTPRTPQARRRGERQEALIPTFIDFADANRVRALKVWNKTCLRRVSQGLHQRFVSRPGTWQRLGSTAGFQSKK